MSRTSRMSRHFTFANVCSLLALVVALGTGTAYAANTVRSGDIVNGQVRTPDLATNAVTNAKIKDGQVGVPDLATGSVGTRAVRDGKLAGADVADGSLEAADLGPGSAGASEIQTDGVGASEVAPNAIDGDEVVNNSMTADDLAGNSVGASELADNSVASANVVNDSLTFADIIGAGTTGNVQVPAGYVPVGRCRAIDFAVGGAAVGDAVVFSAMESMQDGVFFNGTNVPSAGTVRAVLCNMSGVAQVQISDFPVRVVTFR